MKTKIRNASLDRAKGIGILLVILGHLLVYKEHFSNIVYYFHMPLFFVISGCFLSYNPQTSIKNQVVKVCYQLLFPYMFFHLIMAVLLGAFKGVGMNFFGGVIYDVFYSWGSGTLFLAPLWFLPILAISRTLVLFVQYLEMRYNKNIVRCITILILVIVTLLTKDIPEFVVPFRLNALPTTILFVYLGFIFSIQVQTISEWRQRYWVVPLALIILIGTEYINGNVNISIGLFNNYVLYMMAAISGVYLVLSLSKYDINNFLEYLGKNSLLIFCVNSIVSFVYVWLMRKATGDIVKPMLEISDKFVILGFFIITTLSLIVVYVIRPVYNFAFSKTINFIRNGNKQTSDS